MTRRLPERRNRPESVPEPNFICDLSGFKRPMGRMVRQWDGAYVDRQFVDKRNPQDFVRGVKDDQSLRVTRPEGPDQFLVGQITPDML